MTKRNISLSSAVAGILIVALIIGFSHTEKTEAEEPKSNFYFERDNSYLFETQSIAEVLSGLPGHPKKENPKKEKVKEERPVKSQTAKPATKSNKVKTNKVKSHSGSATDELIRRESHGDTYASNGEYKGIGQLDKDYYPKYIGKKWEDVKGDYKAQKEAMDAYIKDRYGSADKALQHSDAYGWY